MIASGSIISKKYRLVRCLGEGGMGEVWEALNLRTQRPFALKLVHADSQIAPELRERMLREASVAGRLQHPNVIEVYDVGETEAGEPFLVMELLSGETLAELLDRRGNLDSTRAAAVGAEITAALGAAHASGVVHRDLKPANVFLHEDPGHGRVVKVLDFGVSKLLVPDGPSSTVTGAPIGTPAYMSPEQARGLRDLDQRTDLWSVGVMLFEMVAGRLPFDGTTAYAVVGEVLHGNVPRLSEHAPSVDPRLDAIVAKCLERDPELRWASARELGAAIESILPKRASAVVADFDEDATLSRKVARVAPPSEISDTATTAVVGPRAPVSAQTPSLVLPTQTRRLWPVALVSLVGLFLLGVIGVTVYLRMGSAPSADVEGVPPTVAPAVAAVSPGPPELAPATLPAPSNSVSPPTPPSASASAAEKKKPPLRFAPCPKDKLLLDPVTGKPRCVR
ncbi:MAG: protein kinase [Myxococcales bacterium]|nr:protein kinase [Myxococcales bacterium]